MKLEHLMQAYNFNHINIELKEDNEETGVIKFNEDIYAAYLLDEEKIVIALNIFCNCISKEHTLDSQLNHSLNTVKIIQKSIELIANITQREGNEILKSLGLFNNTFKEGKRIKHLEHAYEIRVIDGILQFSISEV